MDVMEGGRGIGVRLEHPRKALISISITDGGKVIDFNSQQPRKAFFLTTSTPAWISTSVTLRGALFPSSPL